MANENENDALINTLTDGDPKVTTLVGLHALAVLGQLFPPDRFKEFMTEAVSTSQQAASDTGQSGAPESPEQLGSMLAGGNDAAMKLHGPLKAKMSLSQMSEVEGGVIGKVFNGATQNGKLDPKKVEQGVDALPAALKQELWGKSTAAMEGLCKFAGAMAALQMCAEKVGKYAKAGAGLANSLTLTRAGVKLSGAGGAVVPWRFLTSGPVVNKLTQIAVRSEQAAKSNQKVDVIRAMQQNKTDVHDIAGVLGADHTSRQMSLAKY